MTDRSAGFAARPHMFAAQLGRHRRRSDRCRAIRITDTFSRRPERCKAIVDPHHLSPEGSQPAVASDGAGTIRLTSSALPMQTRRQGGSCRLPDRAHLQRVRKLVAVDAVGTVKGGHLFAVGANWIDPSACGTPEFDGHHLLVIE